MFAAMTRLPFDPSDSVATCRHSFSAPCGDSRKVRVLPHWGGWYLYLAPSSVPITLQRPYPHRLHKTSNNMLSPFTSHIQSPDRLGIKSCNFLTYAGRPNHACRKRREIAIGAVHGLPSTPPPARSVGRMELPYGPAAHLISGLVVAISSTTPPAPSPEASARGTGPLIPILSPVGFIPCSVGYELNALDLRVQRLDENHGPRCDTLLVSNRTHVLNKEKKKKNGDGVRGRSDRRARKGLGSGAHEQTIVPPIHPPSECFRGSVSDGDGFVVNCGCIIPVTSVFITAAEVLLEEISSSCCRHCTLRRQDRTSIVQRHECCSDLAAESNSDNEGDQQQPKAWSTNRRSRWRSSC